MEKSKFGSFDALLKITEKELQAIVIQLREIILENDPDACEVVRLGDKAATFGVGSKKMSEGYSYILPYKHWVNLGFYRGTSLDDNNNLLEGTGKNMRHVKIYSIDEANRPEIKELLKLALEERKIAIKKK